MSRSLVSRSQTLDMIELELSHARDLASHPDDDVLRYLIDMAILEAKSKPRALGADDIKVFVAGLRHPERKKVG